MTMDERLDKLLSGVRDACVNALGDVLTGVYVHGSIAFGCFTWEKSDVDFLIVVNRAVSLEEKVSLMQALIELDEDAPPKGFEMSVVQLSVCREFTHPAPYELHYSNAYYDSCRKDVRAHCERLHGFDPDLAAHFTVVRAVGFALCGKPVEEVFAPVPREDYIDSLMYDIASAKTDIEENAVYVILNLCRILAYLSEGCVLSKRQGGEWGLIHLPDANHALLQAALDAYADRIDAARLSVYPLSGFAEDMLRRISAYHALRQP